MRQLKFRAIINWHKHYFDLKSFINPLFSIREIVLPRLIDNKPDLCMDLKDKKWEDIYTGDILKWISTEGREHIELVSYVEDEVYWWWNIMRVNLSWLKNRDCFNEYDFSWYTAKWNSYEVIGNIHENPELVN